MSARLQAISSSPLLPRAMSNSSIVDAPSPSRWPKSFGGRKRSRTSSNPLLSQAEAMEFLALPDKVRQRLFTREEQIWIRARCELALLDAPRELLTELDTMSISRPSTRHSYMAPANNFASTDAHTEYPVPAIPSEYTEASTDEIPSSDEEFQGLADEEIEDFDAGPALVPAGSVQEQKSFLRSPTVASENIPWDSPMAASTGFPLALPPQDVSRLSIRSIPGRASPPHPIKITPASHYTDPETRAKLREYLSTPERFDEAIQYGFPRKNSTSSILSNPISPTSLTAPSKNCMARRSTISGLQRSISASVEEEDEADFSSVSSMESPVTPGFTGHVTNTAGFPFYEAAGKGTQTPVQYLRQPSTFRIPDFSDRDMTIRMTLTRPELRASDEEIYGWQKSRTEMVAASPPVSPGCEERADPLALADLIFSDDVTGQSGAFAKSDSKRKSIWRTISKK